MTPMFWISRGCCHTTIGVLVGTVSLIFLILTMWRASLVPSVALATGILTLLFVMQHPCLSDKSCVPLLGPVISLIDAPKSGNRKISITHYPLTTWHFNQIYMACVLFAWAKFTCKSRERRKWAMRKQTKVVQVKIKVVDSEILLIQ